MGKKTLTSKYKSVSCSQRFFSPSLKVPDKHCIINRLLHLALAAVFADVEVSYSTLLFEHELGLAVIGIVSQKPASKASCPEVKIKLLEGVFG